MKELTAEREVCLALGYFDSVHLGHRSVIALAREHAAKIGAECAVATFSNNAYKVFNSAEKTVYTYPERCKLLEPLCDSVLPMRFDAGLKDMSAEAFLDKLFSGYKIKALVCGYDYLFGAGGTGDAALLSSYCEAHGVPAIVAPEYDYNGVRVSTTEIKKQLAAGQIEQANTFLGEPFMLTGKVVHGRGAGRMFNIPTANIKFSADKLVPAAGVYGTTCVIDGEEFYGATNVGGRPTFDLTKKVVEMMIGDFDDNLYDKDITIYFHKYLRPIKKFDTPVQLSAQVHEDIGWYKK